MAEGALRVAEMQAVVQGQPPRDACVSHAAHVAQLLLPPCARAGVYLVATTNFNLTRQQNDGSPPERLPSVSSLSSSLSPRTPAGLSASGIDVYTLAPLCS